jgi:hypothetical protein
MIKVVYVMQSIMLKPISKLPNKYLVQVHSINPDTRVNYFSLLFAYKVLQSLLDNPEDLLISALSNYIKALGGNLKLIADFPQKEIVLAQFE